MPEVVATSSGTCSSGAGITISVVVDNTSRIRAATTDVAFGVDDLHVALEAGGLAGLGRHSKLSGHRHQLRIQS